MISQWKFRRKKQAALEAIRNDERCPYWESKSLMKDPDFCFQAIQKLGDTVIPFLSDCLKDDKEFCLALLAPKARRSFLLLAKLSPRLQDDRDVVWRSVKNWGPTLEYASPQQRDDKVIVICALRNAGSLEFASDRLKDDKEVVLEAIKCSGIGGKVLRFASPRMQANKEVLQFAIRNDPVDIEFASAGIRDDEAFMLEVVSKWGHLLEYASDRLKDRDHLVLKAVQQYEGAILHASDRLKNDLRFNQKILRASGSTLRLVPAGLRRDKSLVLAAVNNDPIALRYALGGLNQDRECLIASGLWQHGYSDRKREDLEKEDQGLHRRPRVVLSTRFSLTPNSSTTATEFTLLFKSHQFFEEHDIVLYSPNAFDKKTCDPQWTRIQWPCRGTPETCQMEDSAMKENRQPTLESCWRYSFRYQLQEAKRTNGYMIQVVELQSQTALRESGRTTTTLEYQLGKGQEIEAIMAAQVGVKVFRVLEPGYISNGKVRYPESFDREDMDALVSRIEDFLDSDQSDLTPESIDCGLPTKLS